jgi:uncharacterized repeat protein (TIGR03803 family)
MSSTQCSLKRRGPRLLLVAAVLGLFVLATQPVQAQTFRVLHSFNGGDGAYPEAGLLMDAQGNFYGTTFGGGAYGQGTVFKVTADGAETVLHSFAGGDGSGPIAGLVMDAQGNLYGTTSTGGITNPNCAYSGCGVVFEITPSGTETVLYSFTGGADGNYPIGGLARDTQGNLYGTTRAGGCYRRFGLGCGTVFEVTPSGEFTVLYGFPPTDNGHPTGANGDLVMDAQGNLYGTTQYDGPKRCPFRNFYGCGTVFEVTPNGTQIVLHTFSGGADGRWPVAGLVQDPQGNFWGTTFNGGPYRQFGVVFEVTSTGGFGVLYGFQGFQDGRQPNAGLVLDAQGNLYGTTRGGGLDQGTIFKVAPNGVETVLHCFVKHKHGAYKPSGRLIRDAQGNLYGTSIAGGAYGYGTVYELTP